MDVISSGIKPITLLKEEIEVASAGSFADGETSIPFEFAVTPVAGQSLHESYHGVFLNVIYSIRVECDRGSWVQITSFLIRLSLTRAC